MLFLDRGHNGAHGEHVKAVEVFRAQVEHHSLRPDHVCRVLELDVPDVLFQWNRQTIAIVAGVASGAGVVTSTLRGWME
jgi:hypothetical protein